jgi:hypothetical protein
MVSLSMCIHINIHIHICMYVYVYFFSHINMHRYIYMCTIFAPIHTYIHTYIIYMYTYPLKKIPYSPCKNYNLQKKILQKETKNPLEEVL